MQVLCRKIPKTIQLTPGKLYQVLSVRQNENGTVEYDIDIDSVAVTVPAEYFASDYSNVPALGDVVIPITASTSKIPIAQYIVVRIFDDIARLKAILPPYKRYCRSVDQVQVVGHMPLSLVTQFFT